MKQKQYPGELHSPLSLNRYFQQDTEKLEWWQDAVAYQIYPRSFKDTNGDGIGDLPGIAQKLDYLQNLGIGMIWLSPIYHSPMKDGGYDVASYHKIDPVFGTMEDFDKLVGEADKLGIKIILDFPANHTSDQHVWFQESRQRKDNPSQDWYIWAEPAPGGGPPNNWLSFFGGSAWMYVPERSQYYLHKFLPEQPDLNLWNPEVQEALLGEMEFWLNKGVGGFRFDIHDGTFEERNFTKNWEKVHGSSPLAHDQYNWRRFYYQFGAVYRWTKKISRLLERYNAVGVGEVNSDDLANVARLYQAGLHLPFNFGLLNITKEQRPTPAIIKRNVDKYMASLSRGAWPTNVIGNHDNNRLVTRMGKELTPIYMTLLLTVGGTPFIYNGDEIGMESGVITEDINHDPQAIHRGLAYSRDCGRTPIQWDATQHAGFSDGQPWLPVNQGYETLNVATEEHDPSSMLSLTKRLIKLRKVNPAILAGRYVPYEIVSEDVFVFGRDTATQQTLTALNFSGNSQLIRLPKRSSKGLLLLSTNIDKKEGPLSGGFELAPYEGCVIQLIPE